MKIRISQAQHHPSTILHSFVLHSTDLSGITLLVYRTMRLPVIVLLIATAFVGAEQQQQVAVPYGVSGFCANDASTVAQYTANVNPPIYAIYLTNNSDFSTLNATPGLWTANSSYYSSFSCVSEPGQSTVSVCARNTYSYFLSPVKFCIAFVNMKVSQTSNAQVSYAFYTPLSPGAIAGIVIGSIVGACLLIWLCIWSCNKYEDRKQKKQQQLVMNQSPPMDYTQPQPV